MFLLYNLLGKLNFPAIYSQYTLTKLGLLRRLLCNNGKANTSLINFATVGIDNWYLALKGGPCTTNWLPFCEAISSIKISLGLSKETALEILGNWLLEVAPVVVDVTGILTWVVVGLFPESVVILNEAIDCCGAGEIFALVLAIMGIPILGVIPVDVVGFKGVICIFGACCRNNCLGLTEIWAFAIIVCAEVVAKASGGTGLINGGIGTVVTLVCVGKL